MEMFKAIMHNMSVMVVGVCLFHGLQYSENKRMIFSREYVTVLMTFVSLLLAAYPIPFRNKYLIHLTFIPLLFLGHYTNMIYTLTAASIVSLANVFIFGNSIIYGITLIVIADIVSAVGPFLKRNGIISLLILNLISIIVLLFLTLLSPIYELVEILMLIPISFIITIASVITFVDVWHFFSLVNRYGNEDKCGYLTGLGNVKGFDRHLSGVSSKTEEKKQSLALLLIDIDGFKDISDHYSHQSGDAVLRQMSQLLKNYIPNQFKIFRNGGEGFSVVIKDCTLDQSVKLAENIRSGVEKSSFHLPNREVIKLSVSIDVGYLAQGDRKSQRKVFKDVDNMVHVTKSEGRDKVMFNPIVKL